MQTLLAGNTGAALLTNAGDRYFPIYQANNASNASVAASGQSVMPVAGTLTTFVVACSQDPTSARVFTIHKNGVDTGLTVTIPTNASSTVVTVSDLAHSVSFVAGDTIGLHTSSPGVTSQIAWWYVLAECGPNISMLCGGSDGNLSNSVTNYFPIQGALRTAVVFDNMSIFPTSGVIKNAYIVLSAAPSAGSSYTFTLYQNGSPTSISVTISNTATTGSDTTHSINVAPGDTFYWQCTPTTTPSARICMVGLGFYPTIDGESVHTSATDTITNATTVKVQSLTASSAANAGAGNQGYGFMGPLTVIWKKFYMRLTTAPGTSKSYLFEIYKDTAASSLAVTLSGATIINQDTTHTYNESTGGSGIDTNTIVINMTPTGTPATTTWGSGLVSYIPPLLSKFLEMF